MWLLIHAEIKVNPFQWKGPQFFHVFVDPWVNIHQILPKPDEIFFKNPKLNCNEYEEEF